jgi:hypothetical protein
LTSTLFPASCREASEGWICSQRFAGTVGACTRLFLPLSGGPPSSSRGTTGSGGDRPLRRHWPPARTRDRTPMRVRHPPGRWAGDRPRVRRSLGRLPSLPRARRSTTATGWTTRSRRSGVRVRGAA